MGRFVLTQFSLIGDSDRLASTRRRRSVAAAPVGTSSSAVARAVAGPVVQSRGRQVEERWGQANGQVAWRHLIDRGQGGHIRQKGQEGLQRFPVLVWQEEQSAT